MPSPLAGRRVGPYEMQELLGAGGARSTAPSTRASAARWPSRSCPPASPATPTGSRASSARRSSWRPSPTRTSCPSSTSARPRARPSRSSSCSRARRCAAASGPGAFLRGERWRSRAASPADLASDGSSVLFCDFGGPNQEGSTLFLRPADGGPALRLGDGFALFSARLSPDGKWVAGRAHEQDGALRLEPTGTGEARTLPRGDLARVRGWSWLPGQSGLVLMGDRGDGTPVLAEQGLDGSPPRPLAGRCGRGAGGVLVSPDGTLVACEAEGASRSTHVTAPQAGRSRRERSRSRRSGHARVPRRSQRNGFTTRTVP